MPVKPSHSEGPFAQKATMSSDFQHIRYITDASGRIVADVRYAEGAEQDENLLNASLFAASPLLLALLEEVYDDAQSGRSPVKDNDTLLRMRKTITQAKTINGKSR